MNIMEITAAEARQALRNNPEATLLLDVREPAELERASIEGAVHIPMGDIPNRLDEIPPERTIICMCHLGGRSASVAAFLAAQGYQNVLNLTGGIEAWPDAPDPNRAV